MTDRERFAPSGLMKTELIFIFYQRAALSGLTRSPLFSKEHYRDKIISQSLTGFQERELYFIIPSY